jgi:methionyl-tRNA synthetase
MIGRYCAGQVPDPAPPTDRDTALAAAGRALIQRTIEQVDALELDRALGEIMGYVNQINRYLEQTAPWQKARAGSLDRVCTILYTATQALCLASILLSPVLPERMEELWRRLGWSPPAALADGLSWGQLQPGAAVQEGPPLFPREIEGQDG